MTIMQDTFPTTSGVQDMITANGAGLLMVEYNTAAVDDIAQALANGKAVVLSIGGNTYAQLVRADATKYYF